MQKEQGTGEETIPSRWTKTARLAETRPRSSRVAGPLISKKTEVDLRASRCSSVILGEPRLRERYGDGLGAPFPLGGVISRRARKASLPGDTPLRQAEAAAKFTAT